MDDTNDKHAMNMRLYNNRTTFNRSAEREPTTRTLPTLSVVGAGLGDPELITLKALKALQQADVVLYDALANEDLLQHCPAHAIRQYVGKRKGAHSMSQDDINALIVHYAQTHQHIVRLKGGDPLVFGRGFEEMMYAAQHGMNVEYIPGVSSAFAAAGLANIPLTYRGTSDSLWVLTGSTVNGIHSQELYRAAQSKTNATVVVLMGLEALPTIAEVFAVYGKSELPVAVISNSSLPDEHVVVGTVETIAEQVQNANVRSPAVIVLGAVVGLREQMQELQREYAASEQFLFKPLT
jgi:uroporphyrin-III C-methyltransferase